MAMAAASRPAGRCGGGPARTFLFIMADDLGYAELSCYGRRDFETPNIDRLAAQGMRFTQAYANSAVCSATRMALITGRYQDRLAAGLEEPIVSRDVGMPPAQPTLPSLLATPATKRRWSANGISASSRNTARCKSGYQHFWGFRGGAVDYFTHDSTGHAGPLGWRLSDQQTGYLTDLLGDRAVAYARRVKPATRGPSCSAFISTRRTGRGKARATTPNPSD